VDRRRFLLTSLAGALVTPPASKAQHVPRIGWLTNSIVHTANVEAFREGMRALGYPQVRLEFRGAAGRTDRLPALVAELLSLNVDMIVTDGGPAAAPRNRPPQPFPL
jgi:putative tryptophan/tyrosine transport system substrate-binding protein